MPKRRFEFRGGSSAKFWEVAWGRYENKAEGGAFAIVRWGRLKTMGQQKEHEFASFADAQRFAHGKSSEKLRKGYKEIAVDARKWASIELEGGTATAEAIEAEHSCHRCARARRVGDMMYGIRIHDGRILYFCSEECVRAWFNTPKSDMAPAMSEFEQAMKDCLDAFKEGMEEQ